MSNGVEKIGQRLKQIIEANPAQNAINQKTVFKGNTSGNIFSDTPPTQEEFTNSLMNTYGVKNKEDANAYWNLLNYNNDEVINDEDLAEMQKVLEYLHLKDGDAIDTLEDTDGDGSLLDEVTYDNLATFVDRADEYYIDQALGGTLDSIAQARGVDVQDVIDDINSDLSKFDENDPDYEKKVESYLRYYGADTDSKMDEFYADVKNGMPKEDVGDFLNVETNEGYATKGTIAMIAKIYGANSEFAQSLNGIDKPDGLKNHQNYTQYPDENGYKPQIGDVAVMQNNDGSNNHSGVIVDYEYASDGVTIIGYKVAEANSTKANNGIAVVTYRADQSDDKSIVGFIPNPAVEHTKETEQWEWIETPTEQTVKDEDDLTKSMHAQDAGKTQEPKNNETTTGAATSTIEAASNLQETIGNGTNRAQAAEILNIDTSGTYALRGTKGMVNVVHGADSDYAKLVASAKSSYDIQNLDGYTTFPNSEVQPKVGDVVYTDNTNGGNAHSGVITEIIYENGEVVGYKVAEANSAISKDSDGDGRGDGLAVREYRNNEGSKRIQGFVPGPDTTTESEDEVADELYENKEEEVATASAQRETPAVATNGGMVMGDLPADVMSQISNATSEPQIITYGDKQLTVINDNGTIRIIKNDNYDTTSSSLTISKEEFDSLTPEQKNQGLDLLSGYDEGSEVIYHENAWKVTTPDGRIYIHKDPTTNEAQEVYKKVEGQDEPVLLQDEAGYSLEGLKENSQYADLADEIALENNFDENTRFEISNGELYATQDGNRYIIDEYGKATFYSSETQTSLTEISQTNPDLANTLTNEYGISENAIFEKNGDTLLVKDGEKEYEVNPQTNEVTTIKDEEGYTYEGLEKTNPELVQDYANSEIKDSLRFDIDGNLLKDLNGYTQAGLESLRKAYTADEQKSSPIEYLKAINWWGNDARYNLSEDGNSIIVTQDNKTYEARIEIDSQDNANCIIEAQNGSKLNLGSYENFKKTGDLEALGYELLNNHENTEFTFNSNEQAWVSKDGNVEKYYSTNTQTPDKTVKTMTADSNDPNFQGSVYAEINPNGGEFKTIEENGKQYIEHNGIKYEVKENDWGKEEILSRENLETGEIEYTKAGVLDKYPELNEALTEFSDETIFKEENGKIYAQDNDEKSLILGTGKVVLEDSMGLTANGLLDMGIELPAEYNSEDPLQRFNSNGELIKDKNGYTQAGLENLRQEILKADNSANTSCLDFIKETSDLWGDTARYSWENGNITITTTDEATGEETTYTAEFAPNNGFIISTPEGGSLNFGDFRNGVLGRTDEQKEDYAKVREIGLELLNQNPSANIVFDSKENAWAVIDEDGKTSYYTENISEPVKTITTIPASEITDWIPDSVLNEIKQGDGDYELVKTKDGISIIHDGKTYEIGKKGLNEYVVSITENNETVYTKAGFEEKFKNQYSKDAMRAILSFAGNDYITMSEPDEDGNVIMKKGNNAEYKFDINGKATPLRHTNGHYLPEGLKEYAPEAYDNIGNTFEINGAKFNKNDDNWSATTKDNNMYTYDEASKTWTHIQNSDGTYTPKGAMQELGLPENIANGYPDGKFTKTENGWTVIQNGTLYVLDDNGVVIEEHRI